MDGSFRGPTPGFSAAIAQFVVEQEHPPVVLDLGVGTGLLTALSVKHGALRVIAVDIDVTETNLTRLGISCGVRREGAR